MRKIVGIIGDINFNGDTKKEQVARSLGETLIDDGYRVVHGGLGDIAMTISTGARNSSRYSDGDLIAVLPGFDPNDACGTADIVLATGLDMARNMIIANSDAVIAIGGGAGTLSEIAYAWSLKRMIIAYDIDGWSGMLAGSRLDKRSRCSWPEDQIFKVKNAEEVLSILRTNLNRYQRRHNGIPVTK